jgi:hypothetical protein
MLAGALAGTLEWPIIATMFGAIVGAMVGTVIGVVNAPFLAVIGTHRQSAWSARVTAGIVSGAASVLIASLLDVRVETYGIGVGIASSAIGAVIGPSVAFGRSTMVRRSERRSCRGSSGRLLTHRVVITTSVGGGGVGAVAGLAIGLIAYPPTAAFAVVEGGFLGGISGLVLGTVVVVPMLLHATWVRR